MFCVPEMLNEQMRKYTASVTSLLESVNVLAQIITDIQFCQNLIISSSIIAIGVGLIWMIIIKMCGCIITWTAILLFLISLLGVASLLQTKALDYDDEIEKAEAYNKNVVYVRDQVDVEEMESDKMLYLYSSYFFYGLFVFSFCVVCCLR